MLQIVLVRPGATDYDQQGRIQGSLDIPLNAQGETEVARLAGELKPLGISALYCCECQAARQTADTLGRDLGVKVKKFDRVRNLNHGLWQGMLIDEVKRKHPRVYRQWQDQPECVCPPGGEMLGDARERVQTALAKLLKRHRDGTIAVVAPEPLASLVRSRLGHTEVGDLWRAAADHGTWELISVEPQHAAHSH